MNNGEPSVSNGPTLDRRSLLRLGAGLAVGAVVAPRTFAIATGVTRPVRTTNGPVRGLVDEGVKQA